MDESKLNLIAFKFGKDGVFIVVHPEAKGTVSFGDVMSLISEKQLVQYDAQAIKSALDTANGNPVRIADRKTELDRPAEILTEISPDKMKMYMEIRPPLGMRWPTLDKLIAEIKDHNVFLGVRENALKELISKRISNKRIVCVEGIEPQHGVDAKIQYKVNISSKRTPKADEEGNVNMKELSAVENVVKGQELAIKLPPVEGKDGINLFGQTLKAVKPKDAVLPAGKNTVPSADGLKLYAAMDGHVIFQNSKLHVLPVYEVHGDIDYNTGNISFVGSVIVRGIVKSGFEVKAGGDIEISGLIEGANLKAEGDILINGGIRGEGKAIIDAGGDVSAKFVDQSTIKSGGDVLIAGAIMHSNVSAKGSIKCEGARGVIIGGKSRATEMIEAQEIGGEMGTRTDLEVGVEPSLIEEIMQLRAAQADAVPKLKEIDKGIEFLKKLEMINALTEDKRATMIKFTRAQFQLKGQLNAVRERLAELEAEVEKTKMNGKIKIKGTVWPGVRLTIKSVTYIVKEKFQYVAFVYDGGEIRTGPYE